MLTVDQLVQLETRLLAQLHGEDGDLAVLLAHVAQLTNHNRVMQVALAQFSDKANWLIEPEADMRPSVWTWDGGSDPDDLAERALVGDSEVSTTNEG